MTSGNASKKAAFPMKRNLSPIEEDEEDVDAPDVGSGVPYFSKYNAVTDYFNVIQFPHFVAE